MAELAEQVRAVFTDHDLERFGRLLAADVRWGNGPHPRGCRTREQVLATFARPMGEGVDGVVTETAFGGRRPLAHKYRTQQEPYSVIPIGRRHEVVLASCQPASAVRCMCAVALPARFRLSYLD
jgi:hypothetical protein